MRQEIAKLVADNLVRLQRVARRAPRWLVAPAKRLPIVRRHWRRLAFAGSADYWEKRYAEGGNSGDGSYGRLALFKAEFLNELVQREHISSVLEFGCGDGSQLAIAKYPSYVGVDVSPTAVAQCRARFGTDDSKQFVVHDALRGPLGKTAEMVLSLDVVYHLVEDEVFDAYMRELFRCATKLVVVYSSNYEAAAASPHVRHRRFVDWIEKNAVDWYLREHRPNRYPLSLNDGGETSHADFYVFARR